MSKTLIYFPLLPISFIRLKISETEGNNSIRQNSPKTIIIIMLKMFIALLNPNRLYKSKPINISIIIAFGKTPNQNSLREERPLKSNARVKNNLNALEIVIL